MYHRAPEKTPVPPSRRYPGTGHIQDTMCVTSRHTSSRARCMCTLLESDPFAHTVDAYENL